MAAGRAGANARRELYRDYEAIPPRGPLAALTVPGAIAGWMLALEAAAASGGRMRLRDLLAAAIAHAEQGAPVTRGQARLTATSLPSSRTFPASCRPFCSRVSRPLRARCSNKRRSRRRWIISPMPG